VLLVDVNVYLYAYWEGAEDHRTYRKWLQDLLVSDEAFGLSELVLSSFVRIATSPRVFSPPASLKEALAFADRIRERPNAVPVSPGPRHWEIFKRLCSAAGAKGNLVADAWFAAMAVESGCEWVTADRDYARFPGLKTRHPIH
jgi:toxin-antitoxin system PIN domain toxin